MSRKAQFAQQLTLALGLALLAMASRAQDAPPGGGRQQFAGMQRANGEITAITPGRITLKTEAGASMDIITTDNTRIMKGRGETLKFADLKIGDGITAAGNLDAPNKTLHAALLFIVDAEQIKQLKENLGKTYIAGKVTAIDLDNAKMTVERPDHFAQTIGFDETTSFKRGGRGIGNMMGGTGGFQGGGAPSEGGARRSGASPASDGGESITLADIKVGDNVGGQGTLKAGVFVPTQLMVATPGSGQGRRRPGSGAGAPPADAPFTTPPPQ
jgi:hypothetical protein